jgi:hypothetical protein
MCWFGSQSHCLLQAALAAAAVVASDAATGLADIKQYCKTRVSTAVVFHHNTD